MASLVKTGTSEAAGPAQDRCAAEPEKAARLHRPSGILSAAERLSADLDNDRPYNAEIERRIADCEAGRPIGKTYTADEYLRHLEREHDIGALECTE